MKLPIAERELRVAARSPRTYRGRMWAAAIFGTVTVWLLFASRYFMAPATAGAQVFSLIVFMATMTCLFNINATADCISAEKRGGTLGLLFLTDLKARDVVWGKLAAMGVTTFYALMGILPMIYLPVLFGAITGESQFRTAICLLNTLFFALAAGLWVSARSLDQKRAQNASVWIAMSFAWGLPGAAAVLAAKYGLFNVAAVLLLFSPIYQQQHASPFALGLTTDRFWLSVLCVHGLAWLALWRACRILPHEWQDRPALRVKGRWRERWQEFKFGTAERRARHRERLLNRNAIHWLSSMEITGPWWLWLFVGVVLAGWVATWAWVKFVLNDDVPFWGIGVPAGLILQFGLWVRTGAIAADIVARDRFSGALELLLSTSLTVEEFVRGQALTVWRNVAGPALVPIGISIYVFWSVYPEAKSEDEKLAGWLALIGANLLFLTLMVSAFWTGLWAACYTRLANGAAGQVLLRLLVVPTMAFFLMATVAALLKGYFKMNLVDEPLHWFVLVFMLGFCNALGWAVRSYEEFHAKLRTVASERYQPPAVDPAWWKFWRWGRRNVEAVTGR